LQPARPDEEILAVLHVDVLPADVDIVLPADAEVLHIDEEVPLDPDDLSADEDTVRQPRDVLQEIRNILDPRGKVHFFLYVLINFLSNICRDPDPLGSVNFELSRSGSVIIVTDPDPYSFLATLFIKII
jgi:hypothetical protein